MIAELPIGFTAKIGRAKEHLDALKMAIEPFSGKGEAYSIVKTANYETGEFVFHLKINSRPDLVSWALIVGDCLHNARGALDHLFFALAERHNPAGIQGNTSTMQFPILKDAGTFNGRVEKLKNWVGDLAFAQIEKLQPFKDVRGWNRNILMFLHDFDVTDKHKLLLPAVSIANSVKISPQTVENRTVVLNGGIHISLVQIEDGAELGRLTVSPPEDIMDMHIHLTFQVIFQGQPGPMLVVPSLEKAIDMVEAVGLDFAGLL